MNLTDAWGHYRFHTGKVSDIARQSAYAGIAVIWIFRVANPDGTVHIHWLLKCSAIFIFLTLFLDFLQYVTAADKWKVFSEAKDEELSGKLEDGSLKRADDENFLAPRDINKRPMKYFKVKVYTIIIAYLGILAFLVGALF